MKPITLRGHEKPITSMKINFDGDFLFTGSAEKKVNLWTAYTGERLGSFHPKAAVRTLDVTDDSEWLVVGTLLGTTEFFRVNGGRHCGLIELNAQIKTVEFSYGNKDLLVLAEWYGKDKKDIEFLIYNFDNLKTLLKENETKAAKKVDDKNFEELVAKPDKILTINSTDKFSQIAWGYMNKTIIAAKQNGSVEIYDLEGKRLKSVEIFGQSIKSFSIVKDFSMMIVNSMEGSKVLDPETLEVLKSFKTEVPMNAGVISPLIYETHPGDPKFPKYHAIIGGGVRAIDAAQTKSGGGFEIRLMNIVYEEELGLIPGHSGPVNTLVFHKDGRGFCSGGEEGIIRIFRFDKTYLTKFE